MSDTSPIILGDENRLVSELADTTLNTFFTNEATQAISEVGVGAPATAFGVPEGVIHIESQGGIASTLAIGAVSVRPRISLDSITSTIQLGNPSFLELKLSIEEVGAIAPTTSFQDSPVGVLDTSALILGDEDTQIVDLADTQIGNVPASQLVFDVISIESTAIVTEGNVTGSPTEPEVTIAVEDASIGASTLAIGEPKLNQLVTIENGIASTLALGTPEGIIFIEDGAIASTTVVSEPQFVRQIIGGLPGDVGGIASTLTISQDTGFQGGIFRVLIYRDGEIAQLGQTESTFVAGGVRINPAGRVSLSAENGANSQITIPTNPAGFMSVNIDGVDYKIPFFN